MINRTTQTPQTELLRRLPAAERAIRDLKNKQLIGADSLPVAESTEGSYSSVYPAGQVGGLVLNIYAEEAKRYLSEVKMVFYIDNDLNPNYVWPYGASITPSMLDVAAPYLDLAYSDELGAGNKAYVLRIANTDTVAHTIHLHFALIYPSQTLSI